MKVVEFPPMTPATVETLRGMGVIDPRGHDRRWRLLSDSGAFRERQRVRNLERWLSGEPTDADKLRRLLAICLILVTQ